MRLPDLNARLAPRGRSGWIAGLLAVVIAVASAVVVSTASWSTVRTPWHQPPLPEGVALRVDGQDISIAALDRRLAALGALYGVQQPTDKARLDTFRRDAAKSLAVSTVVEDAARSRGLAVSEKKAETQLSSLISDQLGGDRQAFTDYLASAGLSEDQVLEEIKRTLINQRLYEEVTKDVPAATEAQAKAEYDTRRSAMRSAERRTLANIVVATQAEAERVVAQLRKGSDFALVAKAVSLDAETKNKGGELGTVTQDQLEDAYGAAAFAAERGAVFGPVQTRNGWNVGRVEQVEQGKALSFSEVRETLLQALTTQATLKVWRAFMRKELDAADVVYAPDYRPADPDELPSDVLQKDAE